MRQPFNYYGGKVNMLPHLLPLLPNVKQYCEVFAGGASLFWAKKPSRNEVLNDMNGNITNFYWQLKTNFTELQKLIQATLHSEIHYNRSYEILKNYQATELGENAISIYSDVERAWALWAQTQLTFSHIIFGGYAFGTTGMGLGTTNKRDAFTEKLSLRLRNTEIFNRDALEIIDLKDHEEETIFYIDPPYISSNQGHYKGYTKENFIALLEKLKTIKSKFILSSYPEPELMEYRKKCGWKSKDVPQVVSVTGKRDEPLMKLECITFNYEPPNAQIGMFDGQSEPIEVDEPEPIETNEEENINN